MALWLVVGNIADLHFFDTRQQTVHTYETDSVAALAADKIVLFELRRSRAFAKVKLIRYKCLSEKLFRQAFRYLSANGFGVSSVYCFSRKR